MIDFVCNGVEFKIKIWSFEDIIDISFHTLYATANISKWSLTRNKKVYKYNINKHNNLDIHVNTYHRHIAWKYFILSTNILLKLFVKTTHPPASVYHWHLGFQWCIHSYIVNIYRSQPVTYLTPSRQFWFPLPVHMSGRRDNTFDLVLYNDLALFYF